MSILEDEKEVMKLIPYWSNDSVSLSYEKFNRIHRFSMDSDLFVYITYIVTLHLKIIVQRNMKQILVSSQVLIHCECVATI